MKKSQLLALLKESSNEIVSFFESYDPVHFNEELIPGKWTAGQHLQHLTSSSAALSKAMGLHRLILKYKFGYINRPEYDYEALAAKYKSKLAEVSNMPQPRQFDPRNQPTLSRDKLLKTYRTETEKLFKKANKWSETNMSKFVLPHPLLGKLSVGEMLLFTCLHSKHHFHILKEKYS